jgi:hypothetical protein
VEHGEGAFLEALGDLLRRRDEAGGFLPLRSLAPFVGSRAWHDYATQTFGEMTAISPGRGGLLPLLRALPKSGLRLLKRMASG